MNDELTPDDVRRLRQVADRDEIRQLAHRYAWSLDRRDLDAVAELFVADVRTADGTGRGALSAQLRAGMAELGVTVLFVGNHVIDLDPEDADAARGIVYCRAILEVRDRPDGTRTVEQAILYRDRYRREEGAWRFVARRHELWYGVETAEHPFDQPPADWPRRHDGLGTVPYDEPTWPG